VPYVERPREPGVPYLVRSEQPDAGWETRHGDVRADALGACAQLLEVLAAVRSLMPGETAQTRRRGVAQAVKREAFEDFSASGGGLPDSPDPAGSGEADELAGAGARRRFSSAIRVPGLRCVPRRAGDRP